ncbi:MAG: heavy metal-binding domain-containing protein [Verrucomicrobiota bacterium]
MEDDALQMVDLVILLIFYGTPVILIFVGMFAGSMIEKRHFQSIRARESGFTRLPAVPTKETDPSREIASSQLVTSNVVVSLDYFKRFIAGLRNLIGGRVQAYESLLDRARREAILRLKEQAPDSDIIVNLRIDTSNIGNVQSSQKNAGLGAVEVLATGTAVKYR